MAQEQIHDQMLCDCSACGTQELLGLAHRHCPSCGVAQDPIKRYLSHAGQEIEAKNHRFVGVDWHCG